MDSALQLTIAVNQRQHIQNPEELLHNSALVQALTATFEKKPMFAIWRCIALAEIPFAATLPYTKQVVKYIQNHLVTPAGFTLTGKEDDLLPCYNAMLVEAFSKLGYANTPEVANAVEWIKTYQPFERNQPSPWRGKGTKKYGGCLQATPCFIGIAKTVKALYAYQQATGGQDTKAAALVDKGMEYLLSHNLFQRRSSGLPINNHILDLAYPASYQLNVVELLEIAYRTGNIHHSGCNAAIEYVQSKKTKDGYWKSNYTYKGEGYLLFDKRGQKAEWLTYLFNTFLPE